jgi:hypothetical protein
MADVAFCRTLRRGTVGADVIAHKRAISRWNHAVYGWHAFTPLYGEYFELAVKSFQKHRGLKIDGVIGPVVHEALEKMTNIAGDPVFDAYAVKLAADYCKEHSQTPEQKVRAAIVAAGFFWYEHRDRIAYSQTRPFQRGRPPWVPSRWDCSAFVTCCHEAGGAPDPNGRGYDGLGYTGTLMSRGTRVASWRDLEPGDLIFYGSSSGRPAFSAGDPTHVALYVGVIDGQPLVLSHGSYPMGLRPVSYRPVNHYRRYDVVAT